MGRRASLGRWQIIVGFLGVFLAVAPVSSAADQVPRYEGKIQPLDGPVLLRYHPVDHYRTTNSFAITVFEPANQTETLSMTVEGSARQTDDGLVWNTLSRVDVSSVDLGQRVVPTKGTIVIDNRGRILDLKTLDTDVPKDVVMELASEFNLLLPAKAVSVGDNLSASPISLNLTPAIIKMRRAEGKTGTLPDIFLKLDLDTIVAGQTVVAGRKFLVVNVDGDGGISFNGAQIDIGIHGYVFFDLATALMSDGVLRAHVAGSFKDKSFKMTINVASATAWE
jgi:hypothetical protein